MKRELSSDRPLCVRTWACSHGFKRYLREMNNIEDIWTQHSLLNLLSLVRRKLGVLHLQSSRLYDECHVSSAFIN